MKLKHMIVLCAQFFTVWFCLTNAVARFKYSVYDWRKCDDGKEGFLTVVNVPIQKCLLECRVRHACAAVKFLVTRRECRLLQTDINNATVFNSRPCVFIRMADVLDVIPIPNVCKTCSFEQVCNLQTESCVIRDICAENWHKIKQSCYFVQLSRRSFADAEEYCSSHRAHLIHIETAAENELAKQLVRESHPTYFSGAWIGMTIDEVGVWKYTGTDFAATYFAWQKGEPNNVGGNEVCALVDNTFRWHDVPCSKAFGVICERSLQLDKEEPAIH